MLVVAVLLVAVVIAYALVHVFRIEWFRSMLLSESRGRRAAGILPIVVPLYIVAGMLASSMPD